MKAIIFGLICLPLSVFAQNLDIKDVKAGDGKTTIEITKGENASSKSTWELVDGESDVEGDISATKSSARKKWKQACADWKKEMRSDNKENKVISLSCGSPLCEGKAGSTTCKSTAKYKIKTKTN